MDWTKQKVFFLNQIISKKRVKILIIDNYDSFVYNIAELIRNLKYKVSVVRNDKITIEQVAAFDKILLSPGPGLPFDSGIMKALLQNFSHRKSIFGICLGHQAIGSFFSGTLKNIETPQHGVLTSIHTEDTKGSALENFRKTSFEATLYCSWVLDSQNLPDTIQITCRNENGMIMGIKHQHYDIEGVQFHPEAYLTQSGTTIIKNWLER